MVDWSRLGKLIGMLGSEHDGERLNAARLLDRTLKSEGASFGDLSTRVSHGGDGDMRVVYVDRYHETQREPERVNPAKAMAQKILDIGGKRVTRIERRFLLDMIRSCDMAGWYQLTSAQANWLTMLEKQYCTPQPHVPKARKPGPVPNGMYDECGLGEPPRKEQVMPSAVLDEAVRMANERLKGKPHASVEQSMLDEIFGETPGTYQGEPHDRQAAVKQRFGGLDIDEDDLIEGLDREPPF